MAHQTLPNILLSNASMVTKSCIARFVDDDAFNPCALSNCSTGVSTPLAQESRPCRHPGPTPAVYSPAYLAAFARFRDKRLIAVGKFERNVKYHLSMSSKLGFRVPRRNRNDTYLRAFVKSLLFSPLTGKRFCRQQKTQGTLQYETLPETVRAGAGTAAPRPAVSRCGRPRRGGGGGPS